MLFQMYAYPFSKITNLYKEKKKDLRKKICKKSCILFNFDGKPCVFGNFKRILIITCFSITNP